MLWLLEQGNLVARGATFAYIVRPNTTVLRETIINGYAQPPPVLKGGVAVCGARRCPIPHRRAQARRPGCTKECGTIDNFFRYFIKCLS